MFPLVEELFKSTRKRGSYAPK